MAEVQLYEFNGTDAQKWYVEHNSGGSISLKNRACGLYLDVYGADTKSGAKVQAYEKNGSIAQKFFLKQYSGNYSPAYVAPQYLAPATNSALRLDCVAAGKANGTKIQIYTANNSDAQKWQVLDNGDGTWTIVNIASGKVLDVAGGGR